MSRHTIPTRQPQHSVVVGWDNPLHTFFAQVEDTTTSDEEDPILLWLGGCHHEVLRPEDLPAPLAPYAELTAEHLRQLHADRDPMQDHAPTPLQQLVANLGRRSA